MKNIKRFYKVNERNRFPSSCKLATIVALLLISIVGFSQNPVTKVFEEWRNDSVGSQNTFQRSVIRSRGFGGVNYYYVAGATINGSGNYDMLVAKLNASGVVLWSQQYDGTGNGDDVASDLRIDAVGNVYICGSTYIDQTDSNNAIVIKYSSSGTLKWEYAVNGSGSANDGFLALTENGNSIFAVGFAWAGSTNLYDMLAVGLDSSGSNVWTTEWDYANLNDAACNLFNIRGSTALYIAGGAQSTATGYDYVVLKADPNTGTVGVYSTTTGSAYGIDNLTDIQQDASGNVYVTGGVYNSGTGYDYETIKMDSMLNIIWSASYDGAASLDDVATGLYLDQYGNVYVTGSSQTSSNGVDYATVKYNSAGVQQWDAIYNGSVNGNDSATAIVVSRTDTNKIYVTGYSNNGSTSDYNTVRYDGSGNQVWEIGFNSLQNGDDAASAIALDTLGDIVVTGQNKLGASTFAYTTVKYVEKNTTFPQDTVASTSTSFVYTENKGQLFGTDSLFHPEIRYYTIHGSSNIYLADTSVSYVLAKIDTSSSQNDTLLRVDMKFVNANSGLKIRAMGPRREINNFYYSYIPGGRENVHDFDKLVSFDVWNNVDMIYGSNLRGFKYYFICKPGGGGTPYTSIDLKYEGADSVKIDGSGQLIIYTKFGNLVQPKAAAWQLTSSGNYSSLGWQPSYSIVATNEVKFTSLGSYNSSYPLIFAIDWGSMNPASIQYLDWSTYFGGYYRDNFADVDVLQTDGSTYYCGSSQSSDFPTSIGAYQTQNSGDFDAVAVRIDSTGHRLYSTYYGTGPLPSNVSNSPQLAYTGAVAANGYYFIGGRTYKLGGINIAFPTIQPAGAYVDTSFGGGAFATDAFIAAFNPFGFLYWATFYGGNTTSFPFFEEIYDMTFDSNGNLYAVMNADTATPRMIETGAYNDSTLRGGMILKFDANLALKWATMFSTKNGKTSRIAFDDASGNYFVVGTARDSLLPIRIPGATAYVDSTFITGTTDAYIAKFNPSDSLIWCTYFGGSNGESAGAVKSYNGELYVAGTTSSNDLPFYRSSSSEYLDSTLGGSTDMFIGHFKTTGQQVWTTYCGGTSFEQQGNFAQDILGNIYYSGITMSNNFPVDSASNIYFDGSYSGNSSSDIILMSFDAQNRLKWSSYFGGAYNESTGQGLAIYQNERLYLCGEVSTPSTANPNFPTQDLGFGAYWQPVLGGFNESAQNNGFISRFSLAQFIDVGIEEQHQTAANSSTIFVYPNPSVGVFQVVINSTSKNRKIQVYNTLGQIVQSVKIEDGFASQTFSLNLKEEATGIYFIVLKDDNGVCSTKVIKQ